MRWYQVVGVDGATYEDPNRAASKFWNEGKWRTFIEPLLPAERRTFIEIGCNAGLFLKLATEAGFTDVVGVEGSGRIMRQAEAFRAANGLSYRLVQQAAGRDLDLDALPVADVVLLANMHYYLPVAALARLADALKGRTRYCIVVGARAPLRQGCAKHYLTAVRGYFRDWPFVGKVQGVDAEGDPCPRPDMYGVLFQGDLKAIDVGEYYGAWYEAAKSWRHRSYGLAPALQDFFEQVLSGGAVKVEDTALYHYWRKRQPKQTEEWTWKLLAYKAELARDIQQNGMREPIYLDAQTKMLDGLHRLCIAKVLGHRHVLVRVL